MGMSIVAGWNFVAYHLGSPYRVDVPWEAAQSYAQGLGFGSDLRMLKAFWEVLVSIGVDPTMVKMTLPDNYGAPLFL